MPSAALRYAAMAWISHVIPELHIADICDLIRRFFKEKLLNWIEFGAVNNALPLYMLSLGKLQKSMVAVLPVLNPKIVSLSEVRSMLSAHSEKRQKKMSSGAMLPSNFCV
jgi:hypothetical protein